MLPADGMPPEQLSVNLGLSPTALVPPASRLWSVNALSVELDIDRRTLTRRLRDVVPARIEGQSKLYALGDVFRALLGSGDSERQEIKAERLRLARIQAERAEFELQIKRGKWLPRDEVERTAFATGRAARDQMLAIPDRVAAILAAATDQHEVHDLLHTEIERACSDFATRCASGQEWEESLDSPGVE